LAETSGRFLRGVLASHAEYDNAIQAERAEGQTSGRQAAHDVMQALDEALLSLDRQHVPMTAKAKPAAAVQPSDVHPNDSGRISRGRSSHIDQMAERSGQSANPLVLLLGLLLEPSGLLARRQAAGGIELAETQPLPILQPGRIIHL
jgi:hypothetical protein